MTQLLVVHRDPEIGRDLVQLVKDYTGYESLLTHSESETLFWLRRQPEVRPQILLTQLQAPGLDGFILGASLIRRGGSARTVCNLSSYKMRIT